jgi:alkanesulfonate monooxygenase SsuD/methylene tetrahydromethanopterin reductase-like flavin-dependent oxidoreductase (luciferase family)
MELGLFAMPAHPPERDLKQGFDFDLEVIRWLDELGYGEVWVGEHHTVPWEPNPAPDLLLSRAIAETKRIRLGPGGFLLPFHHPAALASRLVMLDHLSEGRLNFGVAASSIPTDWALFGVSPGDTRAMTRESLEIILKLWEGEGPFKHEGKYWKVSRPEPMADGIFTPFLKPVQQPHPPIGVAGLSPSSDTLKWAGERGFMPMSLNLNANYLSGHWAAVEDGAASAGRTAKRSDWRMVREVLVADTDEEAWRLAVEGAMGRMTREYSLTVVRAFGALPFLKHDPDVPDSDVTIEYLARTSWLIGSPDTVARKIEELYRQVGGFGVLLALGFDYLDDRQAWRHSLELLAKEVMPRLKHLRC